jgi:hypothetical protein
MVARATATQKEKLPRQFFFRMRTRFARVRLPRQFFFFFCGRARASRVHSPSPKGTRSASEAGPRQSSSGLGRVRGWPPHTSTAPQRSFSFEKRPAFGGAIAVGGDSPSPMEHSP